MLSHSAYNPCMADYDAPRRFDPITLTAVVLLHAVALIGLARAFAPDIFLSAPEPELTAVTISTLQPEPTPTPRPTPQAKTDSGAQGAPGRQAVARAAEAPPVALPLQPPQPIPVAASTGEANRSGTATDGTGTGAGGVGAGTGSGYDGVGGGGWVEPTKPVHLSGNINSAADYPMPRGGHRIRKGTFVIVHMTVGVDGRASNCRIVTASPDPEADRITCELALARFRFEPGRDSNGDPVPSTYGWRQRWF